MKSALSAKHLHDEAAAYRWVEARVWPTGRVCPHCGVVGESGALKGKSTRIGVYKCYACRKPFTVKVGTIFEGSHVKLHIWLQAMHIMASSKKGFSSNQFARVLGVDIKTAWFMSHRIRMAMAPGGKLPPMGGEGRVVEVDETYHGKVAHPAEFTKEGKRFKSRHGGPATSKKSRFGTANRRPIVALVERGGSARTFHVAEANVETVAKIVRDNIDPKSRLHTDASSLYLGVGKEFAEHSSVRHSMDEYVKWDENGAIHNNSCESYFSVFKRGMRGVYQHCSEKHLHRYLAEFDFRHNNRVAVGVDDKTRAEKLLAGVVGKRLTYQTANGAA
jgi:transposase-like protein